MSFSLKIDVKTPSGGSLLDRLPVEIAPERMNKQIGAAEVLLFQRHFLDLPHNKLGFPTTNFWPAVARSTHFEASTAGVTISVSKQGMRQRLEGGDIVPGDGKKYLTIPTRAEAYGHRAAEFDNLRFKMMMNQWGVLQPALTDDIGPSMQIKFGKAPKKGGRRSVSVIGYSTGLVPYFWLTKHVHQDPDPSVIPTETQIMDTATNEVDAALARLKGGNN